MAGRNKQNLIALDAEGSRREEVDTFQTVLEYIGPVVDVSLGEKYSLVLTKSGEIWRLGGEGREVIKVSIPAEKEYSICFLAACDSMAVFAAKDGKVYSLGQKQSGAGMKELEGVDETTKKPVKIIKSKDTFVIHFQFI